MSSDDKYRESHKRKRRAAALTSHADKAELERHYRFVPKPRSSNHNDPSSAASTWQDRMVDHYHQHLYKEYVLADLSLAIEKKIGLRWRTQPEVAQGKGSTSCGNKHCTSHGGSELNDRKLSTAITKKKPKSIKESEERERIANLRYGDEQVDFEVPFSYQEHNEQKMELVKLRLCAKCAPLLFLSKGEENPCIAARESGTVIAASSDPPLATGEECSDDEQHAKRKTEKKKKKRKSS